MNFEIGKLILCVKTHSQGLVIKDKIYTLTGIKEPVCKCTGILLSVGLFQGGTYCGKCQKNVSDNECWFVEKLFVPIEEMDLQEIQEILNKTHEKITI